MARGDHGRVTFKWRSDTTARRLAGVALAVILMLSITAYSQEVTPPPRSPSLPSGTLTIAYSPEKEDLFLKLVLEFNLSRPQDIPPIHPIRRDMADMLEEAVNGRLACHLPRFFNLAGPARQDVAKEKARGFSPGWP